MDFVKVQGLPDKKAFLHSKICEQVAGDEPYCVGGESWRVESIRSSKIRKILASIERTCATTLRSELQIVHHMQWAMGEWRNIIETSGATENFENDLPKHFD